MAGPAGIIGAIYDVARGIVEAEESGGPYPSEPIAPPPSDPSPGMRQLIERTGLDELEILIFRILVAAESDHKVHRVMRGLAADPAIGGTPVDAVLTVVEGLGADPRRALRALRADQRLIAFGLVEVKDRSAPAVTQRLAVPPRVVDFALTGEVTPPSMPFAAEEPRAVDSLCPLPVKGGGDAAERLRAALRRDLAAAPVWVVGVRGSGRRTLLAAVAAEQRKRLVCVAQADLLAMPVSSVCARLWREVVLGDAIVCVHDAVVHVRGGAVDDAIRRLDLDGAALGLFAAMMAARLPFVVTSSQAPPLQAFDHPLQVIRLGTVAPADALALWQRGLPESREVNELATRFLLPPGRIVRALDAARDRAASLGRDARAADVAEAIALGVSEQVAVLGTLVEDTHSWDDIVLPDDTLDSIRELIARVQHRHMVFDEWGFRAKLSKGLGLAALFHGPPGTGKTMVTSLIARELGQELYQVDLSRIVSKWIGETEKNLANVFDAAEGANVMLLFDEADALFSKRTEIKSSNDRHANAEVNYLLQRVERFEGVCVLTTNFEGSIDTAFKRRLAFRIAFSMPDEHERLRMWKQMVPAQARLAGDVDFTDLAARYEIAGGNIRNALLRAAFLAAANGVEIDQALIGRAIRLEYRDAGKLSTSGPIYTH